MTLERDSVTAQTAVTEMGRGPAPGTVLLGKYRVEATLGFGGMGLVIRAHNIALDEPVAMKLMRDDVKLDEEHVQRFLREATAAVQLKSEHVARIRDVGTLEDGRPYMVMELLEGLDLGQILMDEGAIEPQRAVELVLQACDAIAEAHALGIVHRDIKPSNLFITRSRDDADLVKVLDFGISKAQSGQQMSLTQTKSMLGTPAYMSPEQLRNARNADPRSDVWALGVVLYELVEGRSPFDAKNFAELCIVVTTEAPKPMVRAPQLQGVIDRCLAKTVDQRFQNVGDVAAALEEFARDPRRAARQVTRIQRVLGLPSRPMIPTTPSMQRQSAPVSAAFPATKEQKNRTSSLKLMLLLLCLFGVGIAAGLFVTSQ